MAWLNCFARHGVVKHFLNVGSGNCLGPVGATALAESLSCLKSLDALYLLWVIFQCWSFKGAGFRDPKNTIISYALSWNRFCLRAFITFFLCHVQPKQSGVCWHICSRWGTLLPQQPWAAWSRVREGFLIRGVGCAVSAFHFRKIPPFRTWYCPSRVYEMREGVSKTLKLR